MDGFQRPIPKKRNCGTWRYPLSLLQSQIAVCEKEVQESGYA
jgi:hypothetical protein